jgi:hypothetical protein
MKECKNEITLQLKDCTCEAEDNDSEYSGRHVRQTKQELDVVQDASLDVTIFT